MKTLFLLIGLMAVAAAPGALAPLKVKGMMLVNPKGQRVSLRGVNVGNWFVIEMWMLGLADRPGAPKDQFDLEQILTSRFGETEKERLMDVYRSSWITGSDFKQMRSFGFNVVRLPMNYRQMEDDRKLFVLRADAWKWIDRAVDMAEAAGLYTILDMHGAQGGQSPYDHTGHSDQNRLKDDSIAQKRLAWLWGEIAKRYRKRSAVVAYDVFNEPYGTPKAIQVDVFARALASIRKYDPDKLVIASGNFDDFGHYGDPKDKGWNNVGFQMHYYPGLFGGGAPTVATHVRHLEFLQSLAVRVKKLNVPFLIGEMNVVFESAGGADMMRRYYEAHAAFGWMTTMWSWKVVSKEGGVGSACWGAVTNRKPMRTVDFRGGSKSEIEAYFKSFAKETWAVHTKLRAALTAKGPLPPLPPLPPKRTTAPRASMPPWTLAEIGGAMPGGLKLGPEGSFELYGAGQDVWGERDECSFLYQEIEGDFEIEVQIDKVEAIDTYTKAGLMVRESLDPSAATLLASSFPSGELQFAYRKTKGAMMDAGPVMASELPRVMLRLSRTGNSFEAHVRQRAQEWKLVGSTEISLPRTLLVGALALSHNRTQLARLNYRNLRRTR